MYFSVDKNQMVIFLSAQKKAETSLIINYFIEEDEERDREREREQPSFSNKHC